MLYYKLCMFLAETISIVLKVFVSGREQQTLILMINTRQSALSSAGVPHILRSKESCSDEQLEHR